MRRLFIALLMVSGVAVGQADEVQAELAQDVILRAMVDELDRSLSGLALADLERPYFIQFGLTDYRQAAVAAELGAVTGRSDYRSRNLYTDVRVGSYELDNTNFGGGYGAAGSGADLPIEDDYHAIRQAFWWAADRDYKNVVETLAKKKAFMEDKIIADKPPDFSRETPAVHFEPRLPLELDPMALEALALRLAAIFREFGEIQSSAVTVNAYVANKYLVNTEGTRLRTGQTMLAVSVSATAQADDGMKLSDSLSFFGRRWQDLPPAEDLERRCRELAARLIAVRQAPLLDGYTGPVLFDAPAAARVFQRQFGYSFAGGQRPLGSRSDPEDLANKLNKRILPRFLNVVDDPLQTSIAGWPVMGSYQYDDEGVPAQAVKLVENGRLLTLLMSRNPSKEIRQSNGHGRAGWGAPSAAVGCLIVNADPALNDQALRQELLDYCADEGLEYGLRVAALGEAGDGSAGRGRPRPGRGMQPLVMYKVYPDGREELVRGAEIARLDLKAFKRILAAGETPFVLNTSAAGGQTFAVPALLFEELDLVKIDRDFDKPPIIPAPLTRTGD